MRLKRPAPVSWQLCRLPKPSVSASSITLFCRPLVATFAPAGCTQCVLLALTGC